MIGQVAQKKIYLFVTLLLYAVSIIVMGYFLPRTESLLQLVFYALAFTSYLIICHFSKSGLLSIKSGIAWSMILRMLLLFAVPVLSDDFYRFIFDGHLIKMGLSPYMLLPDEAVQEANLIKEGYWETLIQGMNSRNYYSIYPPLHQVFFWMAAWGGSNLFANILILRLVILIFEVLNFFFLYKIIKAWGLSAYRLWLYTFNPLVILELTGNLHFEGLVLTGLLSVLYFFGQKRLIHSAMGWIWGVGVKLTPLMLGPLMVFSWGKEDRQKFLWVAVILIFIAFWPLLLQENLLHFWQSFRLYQSKFEFNASIYYLIRWLSGFFVDYNPIAYVGPILNGLAFAIILSIGLFRKPENGKEMADAMGWIYLCFLLLQTVVHPWYIIPAFGVSVLTQNRIFLWWTGLVFLSYSAYSDEFRVNENQIVILLEYGALAGFFFWNYLKRFKSRNLEFKI
ncbi:carotene biosynthesis protein [Shivajiella indica]|uniref:Carotene biosynthesis protein n=1 Tax=Shivajiella indica TaxID=872115 RepID=A0ABW5BA17_9BACT